jgi:CBS domain-containing membrane protein
MQVRDVMSSPVFTIRDDKRLRAVEEMMKWAHVRHVPVVDGAGRLVGILSHRDLMRAAVSSLAVRISEVERAQHMAATEVRTIMRKSPRTIGPAESVQRAAYLMRSQQVGCLPVVEGDKLVGIVTEADLLAIVERLDVIPGGRPD